MSTYCHVCGFNLAEPPWGQTGCDPTFNICDCCGCEFGYEDCQTSGVLRYRQQWLEAGSPWFRAESRPVGWSADSQLANLPIELPPGIRRN